MVHRGQAEVGLALAALVAAMLSAACACQEALPA